MTANDPLDNNLKKISLLFSTRASDPAGGRQGTDPERVLIKNQNLFSTCRRIMNSRPVRFSAAAALIVLVLAGLYHFKGPFGATPAWALEQTIEAMRVSDLFISSGLSILIRTITRPMRFGLFPIPKSRKRRI